MLCRQADLVASCIAEAEMSQATTPPRMRVQPTSGPLSLPVERHTIVKNREGPLNNILCLV